MPALILRKFSGIASLLHSTSSLCMSFVAITNFDYINNLPTELLRDIFARVLLLPSKTKSLSTKTPITSSEYGSSPFLLFQVNRRWRGIISEMDEVWRSIVITSPSQKHLARTSVWMNCLGNRPIDIVINPSGRHNVSEDEHMHTRLLLEIFATKIENWRKIKLEFRGRIPANIPSLFRTLQQGPNSMLTDADIIFDAEMAQDKSLGWEVFPIYSVWESLHKMPSLAKLSWSSPFTPGPRFSMVLQEINITCPITLDDLMDRVFCCTHLVSLGARDIRKPTSVYNAADLVDIDDDSGNQPFTRTYFPYLALLCLTTKSVNIAPFLNRIYTPALIHLELQGIQQSNRIDMYNLIHASQCQLVGFNVDVPRSSEAQVLDWLMMPELQNVSTLVVGGADITNNALKLLTRPAEYGTELCYFPRLRHLGLATFNADTDSDVMLRMLGSRFWLTPSDESRGICGMEIDDDRTELITAMVWVRDEALSRHMEEYQTMINLCASRIAGWKNRHLGFQGR